MSRSVLGLALLALVLFPCLECVQRAPNVQVYSRHPAQIDIELLKNGVKIENVEQSDLSFNKDWSFYLLVHTEFTPNDKDEYSCRVKHVTLKEPMTVKWDRDY
uniref:Beta-2-microglobulin n=1 Tax=Oryctolagus cuniculus TaxID=9986 RepID=A0A5F9D447_RABIT